MQREAEPSLSPGQARRLGPLGQAANHVTQALVEGSAGTRTMATHTTRKLHYPANDDEKRRNSPSVTRAGYTRCEGDHNTIAWPGCHISPSTAVHSHTDKCIIVTRDLLCPLMHVSISCSPQQPARQRARPDSSVASCHMCSGVVAVQSRSQQAMPPAAAHTPATKGPAWADTGRSGKLVIKLQCV